jgi:hypothetical protein
MPTLPKKMIAQLRKIRFWQNSHKKIAKLPVMAVRLSMKADLKPAPKRPVTFRPLITQGLAFSLSLY